MARYKDFLKESSEKVADDWKKRGVRGAHRRKWRTGRKYRIAFVLAIGPYLWEGIECPLVLEDYAYLAQVSKDKFSKFANKNPAFAKECLGIELDRRKYRRPRIDKRTQQIILNRKEKISKAKEDIKRGQYASLISYSFQDLAIRQKLMGSAEFAQGFFEELCSGFAPLLAASDSDADDAYISFKRMGRGLSRIDCAQLEAIYSVWSELLKDTRKGIQTMFEKRPPLESNSVFVSNCKETAAMLTMLRDETKKDIECIRTDKGTLLTPIQRIVDLASTCHEWNEEEVSRVLAERHEEFYECVTTFARLIVMLYYTSPMATDEWIKHTRFYDVEQGL